MRGYVTCSTTACTICTAFLLWKFKPQIIKVRGELAHTIVQFGKSIGKSMIRQTHKSTMEGEEKFTGLDKARCLLASSLLVVTLQVQDAYCCNSVL